MAGMREYWRWVHDGREMCGRYSLIVEPREMAKRSKFDGDWLTLGRAYNIAPTQDVLTVVGGETIFGSRFGR